MYSQSTSSTQPSASPRYPWRLGFACVARLFPSQGKSQCWQFCYRVGRAALLRHAAAVRAVRNSTIDELSASISTSCLHFNKLLLCLQVGLLAMPFECCTCFSVCCYGWQMMLHHRDKELDRRRHVNTHNCNSQPCFLFCVPK